MRSSSVSSSIQSILTAAILVVMLTASAQAAPNRSRSTDRREAIRPESGIERVIKVVKRFFGVSTQAEVISIPTPR